MELAFFGEPEEDMGTNRCKGEIRQLPLDTGLTGRDRGDAIQIDRCLMHLRQRGAVGDVLTVQEATAAAARC